MIIFDYQNTHGNVSSIFRVGRATFAINRAKRSADLYFSGSIMAYPDDNSMTKLGKNVHLAVMQADYTLAIAMISQKNIRSVNTMKKLILFVILVSVGATLLTACGGSSACSNSSSNSSGGSAPTVHMCSNNFVQTSITISKGQSLTLVDDASTTHIIVNGSWVNGSAEPKQEAGAPPVNITFKGNDTHTIGPFNTPGTYHLYCTVHPGMNLTVIVQ
jgi:plastocyanin